jgi:pimeloyl-ACP methyl ester carboxylesterase
MTPARESKIEIETAFGPVWLWGRATGRPVMLILTGSMANAGTLDQAQSFFPDVDVLRGHLPGNHCPRLLATSIGVYAAAYVEAIATVAAGLPLGLVGLSTGALVAMGMRCRELRRILAIEPPLRTGELWPLAEVFATQSDPNVQDMAWQVFGMRDGQIEARDYTPMLDSLGAPVTVMLGDDPLHPRRPLTRTPTLVDEESRRRLAAHPGVTVLDVPGCGHNIPYDGAAPFFGQLQRLCAELTAGTPPLKAERSPARSG